LAAACVPILSSVLATASPVCCSSFMPATASALCRCGRGLPPRRVQNR
jgi:hypothetical protein